ncbi:MAG: UDP-glucose/GDP-mannose dehydrogenase family protein [Actinobacteria bacterium]|nr:UDP-glucose/GDP-mannose dehydrogenase family protein [Actinomycetota bacterium]
MNVVVVGSGYVGLVTAVGLSSVGHCVSVVDVDQSRIDAIASGVVPFHEPGLGALLRTGLDHGTIVPTTDLSSAMAGAKVVMIAVGTPPAASGRADLSAVFAAVESVARAATGPCTIVLKSTVPVGTCDEVEAAISSRPGRAMAGHLAVVSNPEFLREGTAVRDFLEPDATMRALYEPFGWPEGTVMVVGRRSSELSKYAANAMLATRISFMNEVARLSDACGADIDEIRRVMARDPRIGSRYLMPGAGFGGSCFPKDLAALVAIGDEHGVEMELARSVIGVNDTQIDVVLGKIRGLAGDLRGRRVAVLGIAFKPDTDDIREAPSLALIRKLLSHGASVVACDPVVRWVPMYSSLPERSFSIVADPFVASQDADVVVLMTEWDEYRAIDLSRLMSVVRTRAIVDARNAWQLDAVPASTAYDAVGRGVNPGSEATATVQLA